MQRRTFLETLAATAVAGTLTAARQPKSPTDAPPDGLQPATAAQAAGARPRATFKTLYSNDTTNINSCISPYHQLGEPFTDDRLRATIDEAKGVDVHMLQPGLGWVPWWQSEVYPAAEHYLFYEQKYGIKVNSVGRYLLAGGDMVQTFVDHCHQTGVAPFISYRLNDGHHVRELPDALKRGQPAPSMSRFYWDNYTKYRLGTDPTDWGQGVFNWAVAEVRENKFALIREVCQKYAIDGLELDFMRYAGYFRPEETSGKQRRQIMANFIRQVREALDHGARPGQHRWLCVRVPAWIESHDALGIELRRFVDEGVDMVNLSASYFTTQATDLPHVCKMLPDTPVYLEMTHTPMTGPALAGSGSQMFQRTTDQQFYSTAHLAYGQGAAGVSLFNFVYYRYHVMRELGPFCEPPFHVLPHLRDPAWLARQPQWYFSAALSKKVKSGYRPLPFLFEVGKSREFSLEMAPTPSQTHDGLLRLMAEAKMPDRAWEVTVNGLPLAPSPFVRKPIDHPYEGYLGEPGEYACFACPRTAVREGTNAVQVTLKQGDPTKLIYLDLVLP
jgi:hypothetical protein